MEVATGSKYALKRSAQKPDLRENGGMTALNSVAGKFRQMHFSYNSLEANLSLQMSFWMSDSAILHQSRNVPVDMGVYG